MSIADFLDMMSDTVIVAPLSSRDDYGKPTYGTGVSYTARVTFKDRWVRRSDGTEVLSKGVVWIGATPTVKVDDQLTLSDGSSPPILQADTISDEDGPHHVKVVFG